MIQKCYHLTWYRIVDQFRTFFLFFASLFQCTFFNPFCILKYIIICKGCKKASDKQCILITIGLILLTCVTVGMKTNIFELFFNQIYKILVLIWYFIKLYAIDLLWNECLLNFEYFYIIFYFCQFLSYGVCWIEICL